MREDISQWDIPDDGPLLDELIQMVDFAAIRDGDFSWADKFFHDSDASEPANGVEMYVEPPAKPSGKKVWRILSNVLFYAFIAAVLVGSILVSRGDKKPVLGYSFLNVLTWSMEPDIPQGSLVVVKQTDPDAINIGDDITFMVDPETSVTHRVIGIKEDFEGSGERGFETQGIANETPDFDIVHADNVAGVVKVRIPLLGGWLSWIRDNLAISVAFMVGIVLLVILLQGAFAKKTDRDKDEAQTTASGSCSAA